MWTLLPSNLVIRVWNTFRTSSTDSLTFDCTWGTDGSVVSIHSFSCVVFVHHLHFIVVQCFVDWRGWKEKNKILFQFDGWIDSILDKTDLVAKTCCQPVWFKIETKWRGMNEWILTFFKWQCRWWKDWEDEEWHEENEFCRHVVLSSLDTKL